MDNSVSKKVVKTVTERYLHGTKGSKANDEKARRYFPGGDTRAVTFFPPYPLYLERGEGCLVYDSDGHPYIDLLNNHTSLIHGHAHPDVLRAIQNQVEAGVVYGSPSAIQHELAELICERMPGMEAIRFTNSGTEATMMAMRVARAFSGKDVILKIDGGYQGSHDFALVNVTPDFDSKSLPAARLEGLGVPAGVLDATMVVPFNDLDAVEGVLGDHRDRIAAIIVEPSLACGVVLPGTGYLQGLRDLADRHGVLLIFDEVVTFRLGLAGFQGLERVQPDLTTLGKIIGGGFAVGAFGGRRDIMAYFDPGRPQPVLHSGTFNAQNVTMAAGLVTLQKLDQAALNELDRLGERLRAGLNRSLQAVGIKGRATGFKSLVPVCWSEGTISSARDAHFSAQSAGELPKLLHLELLNRGIFSTPRGWYNISTAMTDTQVDQAIEAFEAALWMLRPYVVEAAPTLIAGQ